MNITWDTYIELRYQKNSSVTKMQILSYIRENNDWFIMDLLKKLQVKSYMNHYTKL